MTEKPVLNRREFLKISYVAGTGLLIGISLPGCTNEPPPTPAPTSIPTITPPTQFTSPTQTTPSTPPQLEGPDTFAPGMFVKIGIDGTATITVHRSEMGQGVRTALPMILAEELDLDWQNVRVEQADADRVYGDQLTGGSTSISTSFGILRKAGAVARDLLVTAAAQVWDTNKESCYTEKGMVIHKVTGEQLSYNYLVPLAATLPVPDSFDVHTKDEKDFRIIGTRVGRVDNLEIVTGKAVFGMDVKVPDMLYATMAYNPVIGGKVAAIDDTETRKVPGVRQVVQVEDGVAVVAENTWSAIQGRNSLVLTFDDGPNAYSSAAEEQEMIQTATVEPGQNELVAYYVVPFLSHAPMEPMNCVAVTGVDRCEVWAPTQNPQELKQQIVNQTRLPAEAVTVHVPLIGGGFGRRLHDNYPIPFVLEAVQISQTVGAPIKLIWTREEDIQHDYFHPLSVTRVSASMDELVRPKLNRREAGDTIPTGALRAVTNIPEAFARESFLDEYAFALKQDPLDLRRSLLTSDRAQAVLNLAAEKAGWGTSMPDGYGRGIAYHSTWGVTHVAQVAEVSVDSNGRVHVHRVVCAVDCGLVINPDIVEAQMESGIVFGLTTTLKASISIENGRAQQSNFHDYPLLRLDETPVMEVYIVPSTSEPTGIGEMSNPVTAPAVANAIFTATGKRIRRLPIRPEDLIR